jgi:uncharacterized protein YebE (UPF0316 family)
MISLDFGTFLGGNLHETVLFPVLIFTARVCDVSLGTLRMVFISRGMKGRAALLGFFEILIWLTAITYILQNLTAISNYFAYAGGFAMGNYLGLKIEEKMAIGLLGVTVITNRDARSLIGHLKEQKYGLTIVSALGATGRVRMVHSVIRRKDLESLRRTVEEFHPNAFLTVQNVRSASKPVHPPSESVRGPLGWLRKGK